MIPPPKPPAELADRHKTMRAFAPAEEGDRVFFLERADYVSPDYARRLLVEFDWHRAAADLDPWKVRAYVRKEHATSPNGAAWRLAQRATWSPSLRAACENARAWMLSHGLTEHGPPRPHGRPRKHPETRRQARARLAREAQRATS